MCWGVSGHPRNDALLDEIEKSGMSGLSGQKFAALVGVKYPTFATWAQRRRARGSYPPVKRAKRLRWVEAVAALAPDEGGQKPLVLELPGGAKVEIHDRNAVGLGGDPLLTGFLPLNAAFGFSDCERFHQCCSAQRGLMIFQRQEALRHILDGFFR